MCSESQGLLNDSREKDNTQWNQWNQSKDSQELHIPTCYSVMLTLCYPMDSSMPTSFALHYHSLLGFMPIESVMLSNHLILCPHFSVSLQSFPASGSFQMSWFFPSGGQSIGASASASVLPMNIRDWFPFRLTGSISLLSKGLSRVFSKTTVQKHQFFSAQPSLWSISHTHTWLLETP